MTRRHGGMDWTQAMIDSLTAYWNSGMKSAEIATVMAREFQQRFTKNAIMGKAHRLRLPARPSPIRRGPIRTKKSAPVTAPQQASAPSGLLASKVALERAMVSPHLKPMPFKAKPDPVSPLDGIGVLSAEMKTSHCQWPLWDGALPPLDERRHCGCAVAPGRPYCAGHAAIAYTKIKPRPEGVLLAFHDRASEALRAKFSSRVQA